MKARCVALLWLILSAQACAKPSANRGSASTTLPVQATLSASQVVLGEKEQHAISLRLTQAGVPVVGATVSFALVGQTGGASLSLTAATTDGSGTATSSIIAGDKQASFSVDMGLPSGATESVQIIVPPSPIGRYDFDQILDTVAMLPPGSREDVALDDLTRALIDPAAFLLDGVALCDANGNVSITGGCPLVSTDPDWIQSCTQDFGKLIDDLIDMAASPWLAGDRLRTALTDIGTTLRTPHMKATFWIRTYDPQTGRFDGEVEWNELAIVWRDGCDASSPQCCGHHVYATSRADAAPMRVNVSGTATLSGNDFSLAVDPADADFAYGFLGIALLEDVLLPQVAPYLDSDGDGVVTLLELANRFFGCDSLQVGSQSRQVCDDSNQALITFVEDDLIRRLRAQPSGAAAVHLALSGDLSDNDGDGTRETFSGFFGLTTGTVTPNQTFVGRIARDACVTDADCARGQTCLPRASVIDACVSQLGCE